MGLVYLPTFGFKIKPNVGKYTSPMDPMGINQHVSLKIMRPYFLHPMALVPVESTLFRIWTPGRVITMGSAPNGGWSIGIRLYLRLQIWLFCWYIYVKFLGWFGQTTCHPKCTTNSIEFSHVENLSQLRRIFGNPVLLDRTSLGQASVCKA